MRRDPSQARTQGRMAAGEARVALKRLEFRLKEVEAERDEWKEKAEHAQSKCETFADIWARATTERDQLAKELETFEVNADRTFEEAWAEQEKKGYQYGRDALEQVRFGWVLRGQWLTNQVVADWDCIAKELKETRRALDMNIDAFAQCVMSLEAKLDAEAPLATEARIWAAKVVGTDDEPFGSDLHTELFRIAREQVKK